MLNRARVVVLVLAMVDPLASLRGYGQDREPVRSQEQSRLVSARVGDVTRVDGDVWLKQRDESDLQSLRIGRKLSAGDVVLTGAQGRAEWSLNPGNPGSYLQIAPHSQVSIYEESVDQMHFDIFQGEVFVIVGTFARGEALELDTPYALLTVRKRGRYRVRVAANNDTDADVALGELRFVNSKGQTGRVTKHKHVRFFATKE
ncbi:MAG TPA: FecR domain-containing protein [Blastocatellia bacterium]|nr:FecR domain-containing protein [Blastocatellia bacterium]